MYIFNSLMIINVKSEENIMSIHEQHAKIFKALCDERRLAIIEILRQGERCACKLLDDLPIGQSTLSHHMKILCDSGLVNGRRDGKWMHYSINQANGALSVDLLKQLITVNAEQVCLECCA